MLSSNTSATSDSATFVEDVFSTYLYTGNDSGLTIENGISLGNSGSGKSVAFNGTTDYLSKSSDLTGAADGKTFTFSAWVYITGTGTDYRVYHSNDTGSGWPRFAVYINCSSTSSTTVTFVGAPSDGSIQLNVGSPVGAFGQNGWNHILASFDMASQANSKMYINDVSVTPTFNTFNNTDISFANNEHYVGAESSSAGKVQGRLSNVYLDYTYRNLATESNRRLFRTADGQPATGQASLSPILYMPLDGTTANTGVNSGTGGNFTVNGSPTVLTTGGPFVASGVGKGGLVWFKTRTASYGHYLTDSSIGITNYLQSWKVDAAQTGVTTRVTSFNSNGFSIGSNAATNGSTEPMSSWTFRKQPKFFDVVTYTGDGSSLKTISHNLGSVPGCIIVKSTSSASWNWIVYHRSLGISQKIQLNLTDAAVSENGNFGGTSPTSTEFSVGYNATNQSGTSYVAYVFAHDAGGFGLTGTDNVISCGSFTTDGSAASTVNLGYEPQWILYKRSSGAQSWKIMDNMRGMSMTSWSDLQPNVADAENTFTSSTYPDGFVPTSTGFKTGGGFLYSSSDYIYIAIRRGPMKVPTTGTSVYNAVARNGTGATAQITTVGFPPDAVWGRRKDANYGRNFDRLRGANKSLIPALTNAEASPSDSLNSYDMSGFSVGADPSEHINASGIPYIYWNFKRAPSFFDEVCYTGTGSYPFTINHNLGVVPEMMIIKTRSTADGWYVYSKPITSPNANWYQNYTVLNNSPGSSSDLTSFTSTPTSTTIPVAAYYAASGTTYIAYLFATCAGISKVGSYTGTGTTNPIDCGFTAGARFVLIKRTSGAGGDWYIWDSVRGIVSGNDPYLVINNISGSPPAEVTNTDYIDPYSAGFELSSTAPADLNASGGTYIFFAVA
jgi:hypothetical protein